MELDRIDAVVRTESISHDGTYRQAMEVDWIDAAILAEELAKIYSTPTPKGGRSRKK